MAGGTVAAISAMLLIADDARSARHVRDQAKGGGSAVDGESGFFDAGDAADFYSGSARGFHL